MFGSPHSETNSTENSLRVVRLWTLQKRVLLDRLYQHKDLEWAGGQCALPVSTSTGVKEGVKFA